MSLVEKIMSGYYLFVEPWQIAWKKPDRLKACRCTSLHDVLILPAPSIIKGKECGGVCDEILSSQQSSLQKFIHKANLKHGWLSKFYCLPAVIDLGKYPNPQSYEQALKKLSGGNTTREVLRASEKYYCRIINRHAHAEDILTVTQSKLFRTGGLVLSALVGRIFSATTEQANSDISVPTLSCHQHYRMDWGVFLKSSESNPTSEKTERLVGYLYLRRANNALRIMSFMGHGDYLSEGVMKLLLVEVMRWVLAREDKAVLGLEYFQYGAIEQGKIGLLMWKRKFGFEPAIFP